MRGDSTLSQQEMAAIETIRGGLASPRIQTRSWPEHRVQSRAMRALLNLVNALLRCALAFFRSRTEQAIVELALRQQLATYTLWRRRGSRLHLLIEPSG
jgi:hypothetical protein